MWRNSMRYIIPALVLLILPLAVIAINSNAGEYGFQFLQIPVNPVAAALAGNGIYGTNFSGAYLYNPASNLMDERFSLSLNHTLWLVDTNCTQIAYSNGNRSRHFGLAARVLDYGEIETRDDTGLIIGNYHPLDANLLANLAFRITPDHLVGINAGLLYEKLDTASSYGFNADLGYIFLTPVTNAIAFASVRNLGLTSKMDEETIKLPTTFEAGLGYAYPMNDYTLSSQVALNKASGSDVRATVSTELAMWQLIKLRLGYKVNYDEDRLTAGLGINWRNLDIDYGWTYNSDRLNDTHSFGITYNF
jgi:hypothetical protein